MPRSLRTFQLLNEMESPWKTMMTGLNVLRSPIDFLSQNILGQTLLLRELKISQLSLAPDVLFPLDTENHPLPTSRSLYWPSLEVVELTGVPPRLPSGTFNNSPSTFRFRPFICNSVDLQTPDIVYLVLLILPSYRPVGCTSNTRRPNGNRRNRGLGEDHL